MNLPLGRFFYSFRETDMIYRIALLQMNVVMSDFKTNFDKAKHLIEKAVQQKVDIVVLPEMWNVGFFPKEKLHNLADYQGQQTLNLLTQLAKKHQVHIIGGTVAVTDGKDLYNRAYCINRSGECAAFTIKYIDSVLPVNTNNLKEAKIRYLLLWEIYVQVSLFVTTYAFLN